MRSLLRGIGKTFVAIGAVALATAGYVWVTLPDVRPLKSENPKTTAWMRMRATEAERAGKPRAVFAAVGDVTRRFPRRSSAP